MHTLMETATPAEAERLQVLRKYEILDTPPDVALDGLTKLASRLFHVPISLVSLVDTDRIWFKSHYGLVEQEIPRNPGFCASAIMGGELYMVPDALVDPVAVSNPLVTGEHGIRFYAGVPLRTKEGYNLGTFCILDKKARKLNSDNREVLQILAELVLDQLELRMEARTAIKHQHQILNTTAHDLKNPLSIMPLLADMIMHHKNDPKAIDDIALQIKDAGRRMAGVINDLLETAREEAGRVELRLQKLDLVALVQGVVNTNSALAKNKKQKLHLEIKRECDVYADPRRLTEIVDNLINNAIKYSPFGKNIFISIDSAGEFAVFEVRDEGPGLTRDDIKNLYRGFTSLSAVPTGGENSTGLGLSIVKNLVSAHHGKISATSDGPGKGATFRVELPLSEAS